ncbi:endonuclease V [Clostridium beijerinckii]|jgi:Endonuclease V (EC 3.1.21.-)|uniref:Endonuclease V n=2 Tax=Clostridium beijerinckii TaxID=1520 RepID=A0AAE2V2A3_CLOBE|nr:endonuclease V [Clostridium beijerinckii]ABR36480.1 Deoxyribonuclease V [Clostridium beijerinckii NCIMB 8052]AIU02189.1 deoxyribonuclease V [Clostridium beijerinckii ATCC 35702]MBF7808871.1 endonuclease V [Clostridium beijerinckii]NRT22453.1 deoxyribonuclease V [Clostridium beijerinckii]NRT65032.1 deoxyribonuclease V [Clostridium beijerinckii]
MNINLVHDFNINTEEEFSSIQSDLAKNIILKNSFNSKHIETCAGVDLAYWMEEEKEYAACCIVVINYISKEVIEKVYSYGKINEPYIPGYLAFRELPLIIKAVEKLETEPNIFMFDGNGYLHFNHMGVATHASFFLNSPTIGVAKSYLKIKGSDFEMPKDEVGAYSDIVIDNEVYGRALRSRKNTKPIFISCGNYIDLDTSTDIILNLLSMDSRIPIPTRLADLETHIVRQKLKNI